LGQERKMNGSEAELRDRLEREAQAVISAMLATTRGKGRDLMLSDIERAVRAAGQQLMERFTEEIAQAAEAEREGQVLCTQCGTRLRHKGRKRRHVLTETGEMSLERNYYYCAACRRGVFPPGSALGAE
jgi:uncharacterized protein with PIN domain